MDQPKALEKALEAGFRRRFGSVLHYQWIFSDGSADMEAGLKGTAALVESLQSEAGVQGSQGYSGYRPISTDAVDDCILWLERYRDLKSWADTETLAQHSASWMAMVLMSEANEQTRFGESYAIVEDSLKEAPIVDEEKMAVDWTICETTKLDALITMPGLVDDLASRAQGAGFNQTAVRCFGMTTSAGNSMHLSHIWTEHASTEEMIEFATFRRASSDMASWRAEFRSIVPSIAANHLLQRVV